MNEKNQLELESRWPHRLAVLLVCATFPLIWIGGLVTTYDAGMAVPDWPTTYGSNMFTYSWSNWISSAFNGAWDLFIEHGHRLMGSLVGMITIALVAASYRYERRLWVRRAVLVALLLVIAQGVLGGARVRMDQRTLAMIHGCVGPLFFAYAVGLAVVLSKFWREGTQSLQINDAGHLRRLSIGTLGIVFLQLVIGAQVRHIHLSTSPGTFRIIVFFHLVVAAILAGHILFLGWQVCRRHITVSRLMIPAVLLVGLIVVQLVLGSATWVVKYGWPEFASNWSIATGYTVMAKSRAQGLTVTAHVATGSLILGLATLLAMRVSRVTVASVKSKSCSTTLLTGLVA